MTKEMSLLRANCAQACLKLQLYRDAYSHSSECVRLDESNHKGYYRRAESRKALIPTTSDYGSFTDMVKDYLKCHDLQPSFEVFSQAVVTAVNHGEKLDVAVCACRHINYVESRYTHGM